MMNSPTEAYDSCQIVEDPVVLLKTIEKKKEGLVVSYTIGTEEDTPIAIRVRDPLPPEQDIRDRGFHPDHQPRNWGIEDGALLFEDEVKSDEEIYVVFGIVLNDGLEANIDLPEPAIEAIQQLESREDIDTSSDTRVPLFRNSTLAEESSTADDSSSVIPADENPGESSSVESGEQEEDIAASEGVRAAASSEEGEPTTGINGSGDTEDDQPSPADGDNGGESPPIKDFDGGDTVNEPVIIDDTQVEESPTYSGHDETKAEDQAPQETDSPVTNVETSNGQTNESQPSFEFNESILQEFIEELKQADLTDDERETIREQLGLKPSKAMDVRIRHLESKMGNFSAYTEALEGLINEHGEATEFISEMKSDIASLEEDLEGNRQEVGEATSEMAKLSNQLQNVKTSLNEVDNRIDDRTERLENELNERVNDRVSRAEDDLEERLDESITEVENQFDNRLDELEETVSDRERVLETQEERIDGLEATVEDRIDTLYEEIDEQDQRIEDQFANLEDSLETLRSKLTELDEDLSRNVTALEEEVGDVDGKVDALEQSVTGDLDDLQEQVEEFDRMREIFVNAFGGVHDQEEVSSGSEATSETNQS